MSDHSNLRRRLAELEDQQDRREEAARVTHELVKELIEKKQREIDNIKARLTFHAVTDEGEKE